MKTICIKENWRDETGYDSKPEENPFVGEECLVIGSEVRWDKTFYQLGGRFDHTHRFISTHFAPLSNLDERQLVNEKVEVL